MINRLFSAPQFENDVEKNRIAKLLHQILIASWVLPLLTFVVSVINPATSQFVLPAVAALAILLIVSMALNYSGRTTFASYILIGTLLVVLTYLNYTGAGEVRPLLLLTVIAIIVGGLLLGSRGAIGVAILLALQNMIIILLSAQGLIAVQNVPPTISQTVIVTTIAYLLIGFLFQLAVSRIQTVVDQVRESEKDLLESNRDLQNLSASLEERVTQRTQELQEQQRVASRRSRQFEGVTRVAKAINIAKNLQEALPQITEAISEQFGFYHVGIFLNDESNQYATLAAANSSGGKRMLERKHQLRVGAQGIVGYATSKGEPRIALDVGQDVTYFNNPDLPDTHSEMALPLRIAGKIAGALDIQSTESNAFTNEDVETLSALADQVSLAIQNARLFDQTQKTLAEAEAIQRQYLRDVWSRLPKEEKFSGFRYSAMGANPIIENDEVLLTEEHKKRTEISVPIALRGEVIGMLSVEMPQHERVTPDQMDLIKAVAERVAFSAENARLFNETSRRAETERIVSDISSKIGSSFQTESILQIAAKELNDLLEDADIIIKLQPPQSESSPAE